MAIDIERIEIIGTNVPDVNEAEELFSRLFGLDFVRFRSGGPTTPVDQIDVRIVPVGPGMDSAEKGPVTGSANEADADAARDAVMDVSIDKTGVFELLGTADPETFGMRNIHFKVRDIDAATAEMEANGIGVVANLSINGLRQVIFDQNDLLGIRICLVEYDADSLVEAMVGQESENRGMT